MARKTRHWPLARDTGQLTLVLYIQDCGLTFPLLQQRMNILRLEPITSRLLYIMRYGGLPLCTQSAVNSSRFIRMAGFAQEILNWITYFFGVFSIIDCYLRAKHFLSVGCTVKSFEKVRSIRHKNIQQPTLSWSRGLHFGRAMSCSPEGNTPCCCGIPSARVQAPCLRSTPTAGPSTLTSNN